jgi:hypothetical protein
MRLLVGLLVLVVLSGCGGPSSAVEDARARHGCETGPDARCQPGKGTCFHDPRAEALVCLCDDGCHLTPD